MRGYQKVLNTNFCCNIVNKEKKAGIIFEFAAAIVMALVAIESYPSNPIWILSGIGSALAVISGSLIAI
jgi:hypothetical protein